ncbi:MAG: hypothetical protein V2I41_08045, partial [Pseudomonadales bacterium]|nr:hypothetical protein [Pseudomonadales bacterium]
MQLHKITLLIAFTSGGLLGWLADTAISSSESVALRSQTTLPKTMSEPALSNSPGSLQRLRTLLQQALAAHADHPPNRAGEAYVNDLIETLAQHAPMETARQIISSPVIHTKQAAMLNLTARVW